MSRVFVANDARTVLVEVTFDEDEGHALAECEGCEWTTDPERRDGARDVIEEAGIHLDQEHP